MRIHKNGEIHRHIPRLHRTAFLAVYVQGTKNLGKWKKCFRYTAKHHTFMICDIHLIIFIKLIATTEHI